MAESTSLDQHYTTYSLTIHYSLSYSKFSLLHFLYSLICVPNYVSALFAKLFQCQLFIQQR